MSALESLNRCVYVSLSGRVLTDGKLDVADEVVDVTKVVNELWIFEREVADITFCLRSRHQLNQCYIHTSIRPAIHSSAILHKTSVKQII